jgi:hypothetical protein
MSPPRHLAVAAVALVGAVLCACRSEAEAYELALSGSESLVASLDACDATGDRRDACATAVVRTRTEATAEDCATLQAGDWRAECFFTVAERHAKARDRWAALRACGEAGRYYHECLYHAWTYELQGTIHGGGRAVDEVEAGREAVAFWGGIQTIAGDPEALLMADWWYFAHLRNPPARLADCGRLAESAREECEEGTRSFVARSVADFVQSPRTVPQLRDRACRGNLEAMRAVLPNLYAADEALDAVALESRDAACRSTRETLARPWNPIFLDRRAWVAG